MSNSLKIRQFTAKGLEVVSNKIESLRSKDNKKKGSHGTPISSDQLKALYNLAFDDSVTEVIQGLERIDPNRKFVDRMNLACYIKELLPDRKYDSYQGLWTWLSLVYLDQLLAKNKEGSYMLGSEYRYIPSDERFRFYRHLVRRAWTIYMQYGEQAKLFLSTECYKHTDFVEQSQKTDILHNPNMISLCLHLFFSEQEAKLKTGAASDVKKPGTFRRLVSVVSRQLYMNFDLFEMPPERIMDILPSEFNRWKESVG